MPTNFISSKDNNERCVMYSKNDNMETLLMIKQMKL